VAVRSIVSDRDKGYKALIRRVGRMSRRSAVLTVGIHDDAGAHPLGLSVAAIASFHEFGMGNNPERSFLRSWFDEKKGELQKQMTKSEVAVYKGRITQEQALERLGLRFAAEVQAKIVGGIPPANEPATIERKGSSTPLIDTGHLKASIKHKVE